ncbi:VIT1/CCC1 transporter family protein [Hyperthermus butylicus]|uniref:VIT1/CCC1 transporter family protein n=1 Tax=Hyperthermus butylicus TaxID=54248 RepID=UPI001E2A3C4F|nr:VIT1/CCC1 family protein [Hyperthermus butylicus]
MVGLPGELLRSAEEFCRDELYSSMIYRALAEIEKDPHRRKLLEKIAEQEYEHYLFWRKLLGRDCSVGRPRVGLMAAGYRLLGPAFTLRLLERGERETIRKYREMLLHLPGAERAKLEEIIRDEKEHERRLLEELEDARIKYLGYVALGLADAIVEITGVHTGFLGATSNTIVAGVAGLVVGFSAAMSMAGAAYIQAKHSKEENPPVSAIVTGISYILSVVLLALPYFLTKSMLLSFTASILVGITLTGAFTYYSTVIQEKPFTRELAESTALLLGTAAASYAFGELLGTILGIKGIIE